MTDHGLKITGVDNKGSLRVSLLNQVTYSHARDDIITRRGILVLLEKMNRVDVTTPLTANSQLIQAGM